MTKWKTDYRLTRTEQGGEDKCGAMAEYVWIGYNSEGRRVGETHPRAKVSDKAVDEIVSLSDQGLKVTQISRVMGVSKSAVSRYINGGLRGQPVMRWKKVMIGKASNDKKIED